MRKMKTAVRRAARRLGRRLRKHVLMPTKRWAKAMGMRHGKGELPILVYQVGKVGSSTVYYSLKSAGHRCEHVHRIAPENIEKVAEDRRRRGLPVKDERLGLAIAHRLNRADGKVRIVTMVREPLSRNMSAFFQNLTDYYGGSPLDSIPVDEAIRRFLEEYPHHVPLEWFDTEFERVTGVCLFNYPFPFEKQWTVVSEGRFEILVLRVEASDEVKAEALRSFLGLADLKLVRANVGEGKDYAKLYEDFRRRIRLPEDYVDRMLGSKYARHFYSPDELERARASWIRPAELLPPEGDGRQ